ncbi:hypothetical protein AVEN_32151-1 [Araneus ventricosus]|uniref:Uncharacterized protein n=1 Tax=Araneus ventricosus TaxID=182803 RepID=A0A4Y2USX6_ARAVE|nr:hypothetical protein AVEN_32151-1 [Araneus ventricosus]
MEDLALLSGSSLIIPKLTILFGNHAIHHLSEKQCWDVYALLLYHIKGRRLENLPLKDSCKVQEQQFYSSGQSQYSVKLSGRPTHKNSTSIKNSAFPHTGGTIFHYCLKTVHRILHHQWKGHRSCPVVFRNEDPGSKKAISLLSCVEERVNIPRR